MSVEMSAVRNCMMTPGYPNRVLRYSGSEPMVEPICESALARQADVPHLQQCSRKRPAWAPPQKDADALCQPHVPAHLPLCEHRSVQEVSHHGPRGRSRYGEGVCVCARVSVRVIGSYQDRVPDGRSHQNVFEST